jgi:hypothetical protein
MNKLRFAGLMAVVLASLPSGAQFVSPYVIVQGSLSTSSGLPAQNATLTFSPSQVFFVAGTSVVVSEGQCGTDTNGSVVGVGNPLTRPRVTPQFTGTLVPGNYYVQFTWYDQFGSQTLPSPEVAVQLTSTGELQVLPPVGTGPPQATGMDVYIGATSGSETLQGQTTSLTAQYTQAVALVTGAAVPNQNLTSCRVVANDAGFPTGTGYTVGLLDASGNTLFSYPELWQFYGPGSTYNLSQGIPYYHGQVTYPIPILTIPFNHNPQSISGSLSLSGYNLFNVAAVGVGTALPAWGVDVEGTGLLGLINSVGGYLVNGITPTTGFCLGSDGVAYDTPIACSASFYQTIQFNGVPVAQQPILNFLTPLTVTAAGGKTNIGVATTGSELLLVTAAAAGSPGSIAVWDSFGGITGSTTSVNRTCNSNGCYRIELDGTIEQWGVATGCGGGTLDECNVSVVFPTSFTTTSNLSIVVTEVGGGANNYTAGLGAFTTGGFQVMYGAYVLVGGTGTNLPGSQTATWFAVGR